MTLAQLARMFGRTAGRLLRRIVEMSPYMDPSRSTSGVGPPLRRKPTKGVYIASITGAAVHFRDENEDEGAYILNVDETRWLTRALLEVPAGARVRLTLEQLTDEDQEPRELKMETVTARR